MVEDRVAQVEAFEDDVLELDRLARLGARSSPSSDLQRFSPPPTSREEDRHGVHAGAPRALERRG